MERQYEFSHRGITIFVTERAFGGGVIWEAENDYGEPRVARYAYPTVQLAFEAEVKSIDAMLAGAR